MSIFKKVIAAASSIILALSLASCADTSWECKIDGTSVKAGVYIYFEVSGNDTAISLLSKQNFTGDIFTQQLDGKDMKTYIRDYAMDKCKRTVTVNKMFDELGLKLSDTDKKTIKKAVDDSWDQNGDKYTKFGVSKDSINYIIESRTKENLVFNKYYDEGGLEPVSKEAIMAQIPKDYARIKFIALPVMDSATGKPLDDAAKAKVLEQAQGYADRALKGEDFNKIMTEYNNNSFQASQEAAANTQYQNEVIVSNGTQSMEPDSITEVLKHTKVNDTFVVKGFASYYVVNKLDILERTDVVDKVKKAELVPIKTDEFTAKIAAKNANYSIEINKDAFDRYDPQDVMKRVK